MPISKLTNFLTFILMLTILCAAQAYAGSQWNGQEKMAGSVNVGGYSIPLIKIQWSAYNFNGGGYTYKYGKSLTHREKQNIENIRLTSGQAKVMAIFQVGDMLFLLPKDFQGTDAGVGMDGSTNIVMGHSTTSAMAYASFNGVTAQSMANKWLPWLDHRHPKYLQATPLYHGHVSAFRYFFEGSSVNGVAYYQPKMEIMQIITIVGANIPHAEKTQMLNFFLSNYVYHR